MSRWRWVLAVIAALVLVGAVLFAALPYTLPMGSANDAEANQSTYTRCDAAVTQVFTSPSQGRVKLSTTGQHITVTVENLAPCENVGRYRLGVGVLLLLGSLALGGYLISVGRERSSAVTEPESVPSS
jgi:hypothetical protein